MYDTLNNFSSTLSHYISLNYRNYELYLKNKSLHEDKVLKSKISLLQSLREFIHVYPGEEDSLFIHISEMGFDHITAGMDINIQNLNIELKELYTKASTDVPVIERQMAVGENHLRPHLIHFNRCKNVLLDGFKIRESPFWTIHLYMCDGGLVRNLDVKAHGHNNDGIDFEMSRNFLVEDCSFDQGDDAVVIKAGRNQDAWRLNTPCENIVIRNCQILKGHTLLGIGSEISGGIRNIYMHDCTAPNSVMRLFFVKTNHRRGGFIENVYMKNVQAGMAQRVLEIDTEVLYQWKDLVPTYEERITRIDGIYMDKVTCESADAIYELKGDAKLPVKNVTIKNVKVGEVKKFVKKVNNVENVVEKNVTYEREVK